MTIQGVMLDLAGCVYEGDRPVSGALDAIGRLRDTGLPIRFVTNTTRTAKPQLLEKLAALGIDVHSEELFTPVEATNSWLRDNACAPVLLVHPALKGQFASVNNATGCAVVLGDAGEAFDFASLNRAFRAIMDGAQFLALAKNRFFEDGDGYLSLDAGPFVVALEFASGQDAIVLGKPSPDFFGAALASMGCAAENAVMVGDDAEADVAGALKAGLGRALLVRTGKYRSGAEASCVPPPTATVADLPSAVDWIISHRSPTN